MLGGTTVKKALEDLEKRIDEHAADFLNQSRQVIRTDHALYDCLARLHCLDTQVTVVQRRHDALLGRAKKLQKLQADFIELLKSGPNPPPPPPAPEKPKSVFGGTAFTAGAFSAKATDPPKPAFGAPAASTATSDVKSVAKPPDQPTTAQPFSRPGATPAKPAAAADKPSGFAKPAAKADETPQTDAPKTDQKKKKLAESQDQRTRLYQEAFQFGEDIAEMERVFAETVEAVTKSETPVKLRGNGADTVGKIETIMNHNLDALRWMDAQIAALNEKLEALKRRPI
jgi:hypothetical protein